VGGRKSRQIGDLRLERGRKDDPYEIRVRRVWAGNFFQGRLARMVTVLRGTCRKKEKPERRGIADGGIVPAKRVPFTCWEQRTGGGINRSSVGENTSPERLGFYKKSATTGEKKKQNRRKTTTKFSQRVRSR